jgi:RNA polymerase sigma-70 factor (ECF subfamily)
VLLFHSVDSADDGLVQAARQGDRAAFGRLYQRYRRMVHGILLSYVAYGDAEDLLQDVFVQAMERVDGLRDDGAFGGWLARMARNRALDHQRRARPTVEATEANCGAARPDEGAAALAAIRQLPEAYRETLVLRLVEGMTGPEIAARTGLTADSVRVNLCRGMKLLRARLEGRADHA